MSPPFHGADISNHQGPQMVHEWGQVVDMGGTGGWWKATEGRSYLDPYADAHRAATKQAGLRHRGPYHWLGPNSPVATQFNWFVSHVGDLEEGECIQLDIEDPAGLSDAQVYECCDLWFDRYGFDRVIVYMGWYYMGGLIRRLFAHYGADLMWWLPWYQSSYPTPVANSGLSPVVWQWAGGANGVVIQRVGQVDSNQFIDLSRLDRACGYSAQPEPIPEPTPVPQQQEADMSLVILLGDQNGWWKAMDDRGYVRDVYAQEAQWRMAASERSKVAIPSAVIDEATWNAQTRAFPSDEAASGWGITQTDVVEAFKRAMREGTG